MILYALILLPLIFAAVVALGSDRAAKRTAFWGTLAALALAVAACFQFHWLPDPLNVESLQSFQFTESVPFLTALGGVEQKGITGTEQIGGITLSVGVDSIAMMLVALTALLGPIAIGCSWSAITERPKTFYGWLLVLQAAMTGCFAARDLVFFYVCFEFTLIPMWILINLYGSTNRKKAATKFFLYTFTGSIIALAGLVYVVYKQSQISGFWSFDLTLLQATAQRMSPAEQGFVLVALMAGFAVKVPLFPVHTWLPLAHTEAPTAGSVILAGVLLKLGTYGLYRFALPFTPHAVVEYAPLIATLCIIGILYGGLICWVQRDVKKLVAYSSVAHLGFCILGMFALNATGLTGSVLYMINHGLSTGALFCLIGFMYERYHTRSMDEVGGLAAKMPIWATFMVFFTMASVGLPGLNGFVSEFLCLMGAFQASDVWASQNLPGGTGGRLGFWYTLIAGSGMIVAAMYLLYMVGKVVFGPLREPVGHGHHGGGHGDHDEHALPPDLNAREICTLLPLAVGCIVLGVYPKPALDSLQKPIAATVSTVREGHLAAATGSNAAATPTSTKEAAR
jgi:NADH-quinone oxidoreductase subunit M